MKNIAIFLAALFLICSPVYGAPIGNPIVSQQSSTVAGSFIFKASQGYLNGFSATTGASAGYVMFFDSATVPANGTVTPKFCYSVPATSTIAVTFLSNPTPFANGIVAMFSTTGCYTATISNTAFFSGQVQ